LLDVFLAEEVYGEVFTLAANEWADIVFQELRDSPGDLSTVTWLGSHYLTNLVIACMRFFCRKVNQFALTFYFFKFAIPVENQHLKLLFTLPRIIDALRKSRPC
jgi:hypothetical protein